MWKLIGIICIVVILIFIIGGLWYITNNKVVADILNIFIGILLVIVGIFVALIEGSGTIKPSFIIYYAIFLICLSFVVIIILQDIILSSSIGFIYLGSCVIAVGILVKGIRDHKASSSPTDRSEQAGLSERRMRKFY